MIPAAILGTGAALDGPAVSTLSVATRAMPERDPARVQERTGIQTRHWVGPGTTAASLGARALSQALETAGLPAQALRRLVFVSSTSGDRLIPATANAVARELGLADHCGVFDINNACTGYLTGLDLGARLVATGESPIGVVASEVFSPHIGPGSPRSYVVMGDAAGAMVLGRASPEEGVLATDFGNDGSQLQAATLEKGDGAVLEFGLGARAIAQSARHDIRRSAQAVLDQAGLHRDDVDWLVPHQPNGPMLRDFLDVLQIPSARMLPVVDHIGSVGAASVAVGLDRLWRSGRVRPGQIVLLVAVGGGTSRGAILYRVGA